MSRKSNTKATDIPTESEFLAEEQPAEKAEEVETEKVEEAETEITESEPEKEPEKEQKEEPEKAAEKTGTQVYIGPSVRGIVKQYTVFKGDIPEILKKFTQDHPIAESLIVPIEDFAEARRNLETAGSALSILCRQIKEELSRR